MSRVVSLYLPWWSAERAARGRRRDRATPTASDRAEPVLVARTVASRQVVAHTCPRAAAQGVQPGMTLAHARALLQGATPRIVPHEPEADLRGLERLSRWATRFTPLVAPDPPDGLLLDIHGCEHLFGGEGPLLDRLRRALLALGLTPRLGVASTVGTAWAMARFGRASVARVPPGHEREAIAPLHVRGLRLEPCVPEALAEVGIERIGQVLDLPRAALPARYGHDALHAIDRALGLLPEGVGRAPESREFAAWMELPGGTVHWESVARATRLLLDRLAADLARAEQGLRRLVARFHRLDHTSEQVRLDFARPTRRPGHVWSLLRPRMERLNLGFGVDDITLRAVVTARLPHTQDALRLGDGDDPSAQHEADCVDKNDAHADAQLAEALDVLIERLGRERVARAQRRESHRPERAFGIIPAGDGGSAEGPITAPARPLPRPSRLLESAEEVRAMALTPDGPLLRFSWHGVEHRVQSCIGPERVGGEWWRSMEPTRDYFRVQIEGGRWLWMFHESGRGDRPGGWFVHGEWA